MSEPTLADVQAMQQGSSLAAELFKERAELIEEFHAQLASIDDRIRHALGDMLLSTVCRDGSNRASTATKRQRRNPRARNPHPLPWYILIVMCEAAGVEVSESTIVEKVLAMGFTSSADDFHNSIYTTLYTLKRSGLVKKSSANEMAWTLTDEGSKQAKKSVAEKSRECDDHSGTTSN